MSTIQHHIPASYSREHAESKTSLWRKFITWADSQEDNRFLWLTIGVAGHGFVFTIITVMMIIFTGNHFIFWPFAIAAMGMCLVSNLAALPTKITIPILFFSVLIDVVIIAMCLVNGFNIEATYI